MANLPELFPGFEQRRFKTQGAEIFARIGGDGPPLFLLHGYPQSHAIWHAVAPLLAGKFRLIICDLRGYGASSVPATVPGHESYSKRAMAQDIIDIADELGLARFHFCGHDRGGRVGYRLALDHPGRVDRLALLDIIPTYEMWVRLTREMALKVFHWTFLAQPAPWPEDVLGRDPVAWVERKIAGWGGTGDLKPFSGAALAHYRAFFSEPQRIHASCEDYRAGATYDFAADEADRKAERRIACPTAVLWGEKGIPAEGNSPLDIWQDWCDDVIGLPIASGHFLPEENPKDTVDALLPFFLGR